MPQPKTGQIYGSQLCSDFYGAQLNISEEMRVSVLNGLESLLGYLKCVKFMHDIDSRLIILQKKKNICLNQNITGLFIIKSTCRDLQLITVLPQPQQNGLTENQHFHRIFSLYSNRPCFLCAAIKEHPIPPARGNAYFSIRNAAYSQSLCLAPLGNLGYLI